MVNLTLVEEASDVEEEEDVYGELPSQDPTDTSIDHKESFLWLINIRRKVSALYNKETKQDILVSALSVDKPGLFLEAPVPDKVVRIFSKYSKVTRNQRKWLISSIAEPLYLLGRHLFDLRKQSPEYIQGGARPPCQHVLTSLSPASWRRRPSRRRKIIRRKQQFQRKSAARRMKNPIPNNFVWNPLMKADIDCLGCGCRGAVQETMTEEELTEQQDE